MRARCLDHASSSLVTAPKARGLIPGAEVWVAGARAGRVLSIRFADASAGSERVIVDAVLFTEIAYLLRADATARIAPSALLAPFGPLFDPEHPGQQIQQGCFAAAAGSLDKNSFAFPHGQINNIQDWRGLSLPLEAQIPDMNYSLIQVEKTPSNQKQSGRHFWKQQI